MRISNDYFANLIANLVHDVLGSVMRIFMCHKLVAKYLNLVKNLMQFFFTKICRKTVTRQLYDVHVCVVNLSP